MADFSVFCLLDMKTTELDVIIIGAGLTGLALAYFLKESSLSVMILESRDRVGGRIHTIKKEGLTTMEMGATWLGKKHTVLANLLEEFIIGIVEQEMGNTAIYEAISTSPPQIVKLDKQQDPTYRIDGSSSKLIEKLLSAISPKVQLKLSEEVQSIQFLTDDSIVHTATTTYQSKTVVSTLPPNLLANTIVLKPTIDDQLMHQLKNTHTWMGESIKVGLHYKHPFWNEGNLSGTIMSNVGPIPEMYDHSNPETGKYALKGFLNGSYYSVSKEERLKLILYCPQLNVDTKKA